MAAFRMSGSMEHIFLIIVVDRYNHGRCSQAEKGRMLGAKSHAVILGTTRGIGSALPTNPYD